MAKTSADYEKEFLASITSSTGHDLPDWLRLLEKEALVKQKQIVTWLKQKHGLNHLQATLLAGIYLNNGQAVFGDSDALLRQLFKGKESLLPLYENFRRKVMVEFGQAQFLPGKQYVSIQDRREFAVARIVRGAIRVGLDLGNLAFDDYIQPARNLGAMPRISHMISISEAVELNKDLLFFIRQSYERSH